MAYQSLQEKESIMSQLINLARADDIVNIAEISYIFWVAQHLNVSQLELSRLMDKPARLSAPIGLADRVKQFQRCLTLMCIDNEITKQEVEKCKAIATDLRLDSSKISTLFDRGMQDIFDQTTLDFLNAHFGV